MVIRILKNGEYKFSFPMVGYCHSSGDIKTVEVELYIGNEVSFNQLVNADISVVFYVKHASIAIEHHVESIASDLVTWLSFYTEENQVNPNSIVWYYAYPLDGKFIWKQPQMKWLNKIKRYSDNETSFQQLEKPLKDLII
jgi:hypothetical protein